ncbi:MAG: hypothetical protein KAW12_12675 [Candidatus Aminicenantes bacterium]|nr:hypothetical protein [Candidatus Aminicenantes bacterium]
MDDLKLKVNDLGYDLLGLQNIVYGFSIRREECVGQSCDGGCSLMCSTNKKGVKSN